MKNRMMIFFTLMIFLSTTTPVYANTISQISPPNASDTCFPSSPKRADTIGWKYKSVNGKCYKRLYNYTRQEWIGEWIPC